MKKIFGLIWGITIVALSAASCVFAYTQEEQEAYQWAYNYGITTQPTIEAANLEWNITRQAFAKMVINYLENVVWEKQTELNSCSFPDENNITEDLRPYTKKTCSNNIMWSNGSDFKPMNYLSKAQLWTVLSRIIRGNEYNNGWRWYYVYHLNMLRENWIMDTIDNPDEYARRWDVLIMLKRIYEKVELNILSKNSSYNYKKEINQLNNNNIPDELIEQLDNIGVSLYWKNIEYDNGEWKIYYSNGQLETKWYFKDGELNWEITAYYENGQLEAKWYFKNGEPNWEITAYYENGQLQGKWYIKNGEPDWEIIAYYENGKIESKEFYKNWEYDWEQLYYYEDGQLKSKENYKDWLEDGEQLKYYENWKLASKANYKNWLEDWEFVTYYENGKIKNKWYFKDWNPDWEFVAYYENGQLKGKANYKNWLEDWEVITYYENGKIENKWYFKDWNPDWEFVAYYENGQLKEKVNYKNWWIDGEVIAYYENGKLKGQWNYKDGKQDGKFVYYYEDGQLNLELNFKNGIFDWKYIHHFEDGKITEMNFKDWKEDWKQIWYYEDGSIRFLHNFKDWIGTKSFYNKDWSLIWTWDETYTDEFDEKEWTCKSIINWLEITYHDNAQTRGISYYKDWELDWTQTLYYENGQIESVCNYINGIISWDCTMYNEYGEEITRYPDNNWLTILPDSAEISVKDPIIMWEATNLEIRILKNDSTMTTYNGTVEIFVTDLNWTILKSNEYSVPNHWFYTFLSSDLWDKTFQRWLEIKKEWKFYIEVSDLNDNEDKILWKQLVTVVKK